MGRKVLIAEGRAGRPNDFAEADAVNLRAPSRCPFCAGHEADTPPPVMEVSNDSGAWQVRVIPNKFPAVSCDNQFESQVGQPQVSIAEKAYGGHEVIVESPKHIRDLTDLSVAELVVVFRVYRERLRYWASNGRIRHATIFKNVGHVAGASLEHLHSQLVALPIVPVVIEEELQGAKHHFDQYGGCVFCQLLQNELGQGERLVVENDNFSAFCAYAGRQPFETWILPKAHACRFEESTNNELEQLAEMLHRLVLRLAKALTPLSYNLILHTMPFGDVEAEFYHWHLELIPRSSQLAGLELGAGVYINCLAPERAAKILAQVAV